MKLKILGAALLALAATSAFAVTNASGLAAGHFVHHGATENAVITAHDASGTIHQLEFNRLNPGAHTTASGEAITCTTSEYTGKVENKTVESIQLYPVYKECFTTNQGTTNHNEVKIDTNGCSYTFLSQGARPHGTVIIDCPQPLVITHPNCEITIPAQTTAATLTDGISYTNVKEGGFDTITAHVTVNTITGYFHGGICIFLGTPQKFEMKGSVTVKGYNYVSGTTPHNLVHGAQIGITST